MRKQVAQSQAGDFGCWVDGKIVYYQAEPPRFLASFLGSLLGSHRS